jgi:uncharacterized damage-inducible protein DinB
MSDDLLEKLFEHNNWANQQILHACNGLSDTQLDAEPKSAMYGSIRQTLLHIARSQRGYYRLLTLPVEERRLPVASVEFDQVEESLCMSGDNLLALVRDVASQPSTTRLQTTDNFYVEPWVIFVQIINHATEHREQIKSMLNSLGFTPPDVDGWSFAEFSHAMEPESS